MVLILGIVMAVLDGSIVNLALPAITTAMGTSAAQSLWVINGYQLATLAMLLPLASLGESIGYRRVYRGGMVVFGVASIACAMADSLDMLVAARLLQGVGAAGIMGVNAALLRLIYPPHLLGRGIAINSVVVAAAAVAGPSVAAAVLSQADWPWLFAINLPLVVLSLWLGRTALPANQVRRTGAGFSVLDVLLNGLMFGLVFLGIDGLGSHAGVTASTPAEGPRPVPWLALAEIATGTLIGLVYVRRQLAEAVPLLPLDLLRIPVFALSMATSVGAFCAQTLAFAGLPFLLLGSFGFGNVTAGLVLTAWPLGIVAMAPIAGRLIGRYAGGLLGGVGLGLLACGLAALAWLPEQPSPQTVAWRMAWCGLGFGLFQSPNNHTILTAAPAHRSGGAGGMLATARLTGQSLGVALLAVIFSFLGAYGRQGPVAALWLAAAFAAAAAVCSSLRLRQSVVLQG